MDITWKYGESAYVKRIPAEQVSEKNLPLHEFADGDPGEFDRVIRELESRRREHMNINLLYGELL